MQQYADIYFLLNHSTYFGRPSRPQSGVHNTVVAASGTDHTIWGASFLKPDQIRTGVGLTVPHQSLLKEAVLEGPRYYARLMQQHIQKILHRVTIHIMPLLSAAGSTFTFSLFAVNWAKRYHKSKNDNTKF